MTRAGARLLLVVFLGDRKTDAKTKPCRCQDGNIEHDRVSGRLCIEEAGKFDWHQKALDQAMVFDRTANVFGGRRRNCQPAAAHQFVQQTTADAADGI